MANQSVLLPAKRQYPCDSQLSVADQSRELTPSLKLATHPDYEFLRILDPSPLPFLKGTGEFQFPEVLIPESDEDDDES